MVNKKPNILIIIADQLRRDALSCYGDSNINTPNIDKLADNGTRFTNACSTYPLCVPFRYSLMTGQYAHSCMIPALGWRMSPSERTLADEFNENGYETAYFGKWHLYGGQINVTGYGAKEENCKPVPRSHQGRWRHWRGFDLRNGPFDTCYYVDDDPTPRKLDGYQTDGLTDLTIEFLKNSYDKTKPFCCVLSVEPPHPPYEAPEELEKQWLSRDIDVPLNFMVDERNESVVRQYGFSYVDSEMRNKVIRERKIYYAMVENLDRNIGKMTDFLSDENLLDDTIIIFLSDHGDLQGSHSLLQKCFPYEESIGIPLIISGPNVRKGIVKEPVATEDFFPSILGLAGISPQNTCPGRDVSDVITEEATLKRPGVLLQFVWEPRPNAPFYSQIWRGFRSQRYKYTVLGDFEQGLNPWQFFDLETDPYELNNLINDKSNQPLISQHHQWMKERMIEVADEDTN